MNQNGNLSNEDIQMSKSYKQRVSITADFQRNACQTILCIAAVDDKCLVRLCEKEFLYTASGNGN